MITNEINYWFVGYMIIGLIVAGIYYNTESKKVSGPIDVSMANIVTTFVWMAWPLVVLIWLIRKIQTM